MEFLQNHWGELYVIAHGIAKITPFKWDDYIVGLFALKK